MASTASTTSPSRRISKSRPSTSASPMRWPTRSPSASRITSPRPAARRSRASRRDGGRLGRPPMKLDARDFAGLLRDSSGLRALLLYGPDSGLVRERAEGLAKSVLGSLDDPFRFAELMRPDGSTLEGEAAALSFTGGRRVVR